LVTCADAVLRCCGDPVLAVLAAELALGVRMWVSAPVNRLRACFTGAATVAAAAAAAAGAELGELSPSVDAVAFVLEFSSPLPLVVL
jgi:hypothetical protein